MESFVGLCYHAKLGVRHRTLRLFKVGLVGRVVIARDGRGGGSVCCVSDMVGVVLRGCGIEMSSLLEPLSLWFHATGRVRFGAEALRHLDVARLQRLQ